MGKVCDLHILLDRFFVNLLADIAGEARVLKTPNSGPEPLFRGALVAPASVPVRFSEALNFGLSAHASTGWYLGPPNSGPRPLFGAPWWPPPACCSAALNIGLAVRAGAGRYLGPPNTSEKNQTRARVPGRVPVVMHVFHINKIVIISFSEVSIPASLSPSRSMPRATPSPPYPVNISRRYLPVP